MNVTASSPLQSAGVALKGNVHGGSQPVSGANIYLLAANQNGYSTSNTNTSVSLLTSATGSRYGALGYYTTTDANGNFSISGDYTCTAGQQVYLVAVGGDPGTGVTNNQAILEATILGACPSSGNFASATPYLSVNEVTTVAAAYSLAGYAVDGYHVGAPASTALAAAHPTSAAGLANAFGTFPLLVNVGTGVANTNTGATAGKGVVPQAEINTLANILSSCVNSTNSNSSASANCTTLFANATSDGTSNGTVPTEIFSAALNIAHNPAANINALCSLQSGTGAPFQPSLPCTTNNLPNDFTISIQYPESNGSSLNDLAVDNAGNIVVAGSGGVIAVYSAASGYKESSLPLGTSRNFTKVAVSNNRIVASATSTAGVSSDGLAVLSTDFNSFKWLPSNNPNNTAVAPGGASFSPDQSTFYVADSTSGAGGILRYGITFGDSAGSDTYTLLGESTTNFNQPVRTAVDFSGNVYANNLSNYIVAEVDAAGATVGTRSLAYSNGSSGLAVDQLGRIWVTSVSGGAAGWISSSSSAYSGANSGQYYATGVAIDGANHAWLSNTVKSGVQSISESAADASGLSGANGFRPTTSDATTFSSIAVDGSGNVWVTSASHLYEFVGAATPVVTPIVASLASPYTTAASKP